jgi:hypothetical protein
VDARARAPALTSRGALILAALAVLVVWHVIPYGRILLYPFTLLATWVHEMGHGLAALAAGGRFHELAIFADGSGLAFVTRQDGVAAAVVSVSGLLAPPIAGAAMLACARTPRSARVVLAVLMVLLVASMVLWVRSVAGLAAVPLLAALLGVVAWFGGRAALVTVHTVGLLLALASVTGIDYLFTASVEVDGERRPSDIATVAAQLGGHHLVWGFLVAAVSLAICLCGLWLAWRPRIAPRPRP